MDLVIEIVDLLHKKFFFGAVYILNISVVSVEGRECRNETIIFRFQSKDIEMRDIEIQSKVRFSFIAFMCH